MPNKRQENAKGKLEVDKTDGSPTINTEQTAHKTWGKQKDRGETAYKTWEEVKDRAKSRNLAFK